MSSRSEGRTKAAPARFAAVRRAGGLLAALACIAAVQPAFPDQAPPGPPIQLIRPNPPEPEAARTPLAPYRFRERPSSPLDRIPLQSYRSDLEGRRFELERQSSPQDLGRQEDLRTLRQEIDRVDRLLGR